MPWNIAKEFWPLYDKPAEERPLYPFNAEPIDQFVATYKGARDVPLFQSKLVVPVVYINNVPEYLKEGSPFLRFIRETKAPFAILINYGARAVQRGRRTGCMATAQRRTQGSVSWLGFGRERRLRVGVCAGGVENLTFDVTQTNCSKRIDSFIQTHSRANGARRLKLKRDQCGTS